MTELGEAAEERSKQIEQLQETQQQLLAAGPPRAGDAAADRPAARRRARPTSASRRSGGASCIDVLAEIEKRINDENARPKKRYISPATREEVYALYYDELRRKVEERGTRNFPENQGQKLYGELA